MNRFNGLVACLWVTALFKNLLRCMLAYSGSIEFRHNWEVSWAFWVPYVNYWDFLAIPVAAFGVWYYWRRIEWKHDH